MIDRRNDKWSSVKNALLLIQVIYLFYLLQFNRKIYALIYISKDYFPAKLNTIYVLRPQSYFQRVLSSLFFQEDNLNNNNSNSASLNNNNNSTNKPANIVSFSSINPSITVSNTAKPQHNHLNVLYII